MTKEQADKIARKLLDHWQDTHALITPKDIKQDMIFDISAALVDASKVTECAELEETHFLFDTIESASNRIKAQSFSDLNEKNFITQKCDQILVSIEKLKLAGQNSKSLRLPERQRYDSQRHDDVDFNYICGFNACLDAVKALNEGK